METLGTNIKKFRIENGLTQTQFARIVAGKTNDNFIRKGTVNNWEHDRNFPNRKRLKAIKLIIDKDDDALTIEDINLIKHSINFERDFMGHWVDGGGKLILGGDGFIHKTEKVMNKLDAISIDSMKDGDIDDEINQES